MLTEQAARRPTKPLRRPGTNSSHPASATYARSMPAPRDANRHSVRPARRTWLSWLSWRSGALEHAAREVEPAPAQGEHRPRQHHADEDADAAPEQPLEPLHQGLRRHARPTTDASTRMSNVSSDRCTIVTPPAPGRRRSPGRRAGSSSS